MKKIWIGTAVALAAMVLGCGWGSKSDDGPKNAVGVAGPGASSSPAPSKTADGTIGDGKWRVGKDVKPGEYRAAGSEASPVMYCYWILEDKEGQYKDAGSSSKKSDPQLATIAVGDTFETQGCAVWTKQ